MADRLRQVFAADLIEQSAVSDRTRLGRSPVKTRDKEMRLGKTNRCHRTLTALR